MKKFLKNFNLLGVFMLGLCVLLGVGDVSGAIVMADGGGAAVDTVTGSAPTASPDNDGGTTVHNNQYGDALSTWDYRKWSPDLIQDPVEKQVVQIRPYANVLDTILSYIGSDKINNLEFYYWQIASRGLKYQIARFDQVECEEKGRVYGHLYLKGENQINATDNLLIADSTKTDGSELYLYVIKVENTTISSGGSTIPVQKCTVTTDEEQVVAGTSDSTKWQIPAIAADTTDYSAFLCGRSAGELDTTSPAIEFLPTKKKGYAQIFKTEITMSNYAKLADKEVKWDLSEIEEEAMFDYRRTKEKSFLFGRMSKVWDSEKRKEIYRTGGIFRTVLQSQTGGAYTVCCGQTTQKDANDVLTDMMKEVFVGNNGAKERFMLAGSEAVARLTKMMGLAQKQQGALETEIIMGITWTKIVSPFGTLNLVSHPIFDETPYAEYALVIDPQFLKKKEVLPLDRQQVDGKEHLIVNGDIVIFTETAGVAVYNPKAHHVLKMSEAKNA